MNKKEIEDMLVSLGIKREDISWCIEKSLMFYNNKTGEVLCEVKRNKVYVYVV